MKRKDKPYEKAEWEGASGVPANRVHCCIVFDRSELSQTAIASVMPDVERTIFSDFETRERFFPVLRQVCGCFPILGQVSDFFRFWTSERVLISLRQWMNKRKQRLLLIKSALKYIKIWDFLNFVCCVKLYYKVVRIMSFRKEIIVRLKSECWPN